jgi:hypothetical protein
MDRSLHVFICQIAIAVIKFSQYRMKSVSVGDRIFRDHEIKVAELK